MRFAFLVAVATLSSAAFAQTWMVYSPPGAGFSIEMPGKWKTETEKIKTAAGELETITAEARLGDIDFDAVVTRVPAGQAIDLDGARDGAVKGSGGKLRTETRVAMGNVTGRHIIIDISNGYVVMQRLFAVGNVLGQAVASGRKGIETHADTRRFFDSLKMQ
jgi:hypothetical protein